MSNVLNFRKRSSQRVTAPPASESRIEQAFAVVADLDRYANVTALSKTTPNHGEALEEALDNYRATLLELAHRRAKFDMEMLLEGNMAQLKLEAAAYKAMLAGVPESDIYELGEDMAEALESAMKTVAGA